MSQNTKQHIKVEIRISPTDDTQVFRLPAADTVLQILTESHTSEFTISELASSTGYSRSTVWRATEFLDTLGLVTIRETAQRKYIAIDQRRLQRSEPISNIPQPAYREPVRAFISQFKQLITETDAISKLIGILVFGSVARGEADRKSDIDLFIVVDGDRTVGRRVATTLAAELEETYFSGDRYSVDPYVESIESTHRSAEKLDTIFDEGITIYDSDVFKKMRKQLVTNERKQD